MIEGSVIVSLPLSIYDCAGERAGCGGGERGVGRAEGVGIGSAALAGLITRILALRLLSSMSLRSALVALGFLLLSITRVRNISVTIVALMAMGMGLMGSGEGLRASGGRSQITGISLSSWEDDDSILERGAV